MNNCNVGNDDNSFIADSHVLSRYPDNAIVDTVHCVSAQTFKYVNV